MSFSADGVLTFTLLAVYFLLMTLFRAPMVLKTSTFMYIIVMVMLTTAAGHVMSVSKGESKSGKIGSEA